MPIATTVSRSQATAPRRVGLQGANLREANLAKSDLFIAGPIIATRRVAILPGAPLNDAFRRAVNPAGTFAPGVLFWGTETPDGMKETASIAAIDTGWPHEPTWGAACLLAAR